MKKPDIKILPYKKNGNETSGIYLIEINGTKKYRCVGKSDAEALEKIFDALIDCHEALDYLPDDALGKVRPADSFEEYPVKYELIHNIRKALKKAGCTG